MSVTNVMELLKAGRVKPRPPTRNMFSAYVAFTRLALGKVKTIPLDRQGIMLDLHEVGWSPQAVKRGSYSIVPMKVVVPHEISVRCTAHPDWKNFATIYVNCTTDMGREEAGLVFACALYVWAFERDLL